MTSGSSGAAPRWPYPALYGFFCLSGFLIAGSAARNRTGRYLWQRFLRIMPAYWVCLIVTAFVIGALAWIHQPHPSSCSISSCYYSIGHAGPFSYVYHNFLLGSESIQHRVDTVRRAGPILLEQLGVDASARSVLLLVPRRPCLPQASPSSTPRGRACQRRVAHRGGDRLAGTGRMLRTRSALSCSLRASYSGHHRSVRRFSQELFSISTATRCRTQAGLPWVSSACS